MTDIRLSWRPQRPEDKAKNWGLRHFMSPELWRLAAEIESRNWPIAQIGDQGATPHCEGFSWLTNGRSEPIVDDWTNDMGHTLYYRAKEYDGEPRAENGSTTLSGVKAFMDYTNVENNVYAWAQSEAEVRAWVVVKSPVNVGTWWLEGMMDVDSRGFVHLTGQKVGGHAWVVSGYDAELDAYICTNSWGTGWGMDGQFYLAPADLAALLADEGDACTVVEVGGTPPEPQPKPGCLGGLFAYLWSRVRS